jgi:hypothetical protein
MIAREIDRHERIPRTVRVPEQKLRESNSPRDIRHRIYT